MRCSMIFARAAATVAFVSAATVSLFVGRADATSHQIGSRAEMGPVGPQQSCVKMMRGNHLCSGTIVAVSGETCLILCCNHCFADRPWPGGRIPKGKYPADCTIERLSDGKRVQAVAVDGDPDVDSALIVARGLEGAVAAPVGSARVGDSCEHWGISSEHARGVIRVYDTSGRMPPDQSERSTVRSIPGDSGAGVWSGGGLVAVNWGYWGSGEQGGTAVVYHLRFAKSSERYRRGYPALWDATPSGAALPALPAPPQGGGGLAPGGAACPPGGCPVMPAPTRPRLLPWRR